MKSVIVALSFFIAHCAFSQGITNTLGNNGVFTIKDGSKNFFTITQSTGQVNIFKTLRLENTTNSTTGIIFKDTTRFLHTYGTNNLFLGISSGNFNLTGTGNTGLGYQSLTANTTGNFNTSVGYLSMKSNAGGLYNTAVGYQSLSLNVNGIYNTALGYNSIGKNTGGSENTGIGAYSLYSNISGESNVGIGSSSLYFNTTGYFNSAVGAESLINNTTGHDNTGIGYSALNDNVAGIQNTSVGSFSLHGNTSGNNNTSVGYNSMYWSTTAIENTAIGTQSLFNNLADYNSALGYRSLNANTSGSKSTAIGHESLINNTTGSQNTALGYSTGTLVTTGSNITLIGYNAEPTSAIVSNQITLGNNQVTSLRCNVTTITSLSDARDKKNIKDLSLGIDFLMKVKPRLFNWDKREWYENNISDGSKMNEAPTAGFIAQELDEVQSSENAEWLNLVLKDNPEKLEATYGNLLPVMVKAIQELKTENEELKMTNAGLSAMQESLASEVEALRLMNTRIVQLEQIINEMNLVKPAPFIQTEEVNLTNTKED